MTVRSSLHATKGRGSRTMRREDAGPEVVHELPPAVLRETRFKFCTESHDLRGAVRALLRRCGASLGQFSSPAAARRRAALAAADAALPSGHTCQSWLRPRGVSVPVGHTTYSWGTARNSAQPDEAPSTLGFPPTSAPGSAECQERNDGSAAAAEPERLEDFHLDADAWQSVDKQELLTRAVLDDARLLACFEDLVRKAVLPRFKALLVEHEPERYADDRPVRFFYQYPPTLRLQGGPSCRFVRGHTDADYGHQPGELNFWLPLTSYELTRTTLWVESLAGAEDYHPLELGGHGDIGSFHGTLCRHHVPANATCFTRVSLDFRVGVEGCFDPQWKFKGTSMDHVRRSLEV